MPCKSCEERWRIILANQEKNNIMTKKVLKKEIEEIDVIVEKEQYVNSKPNINKIIEDRRKVLLEDKTVNK